MEGSFRRALEPSARRAAPPTPPARFDSPAPHPVADVFDLAAADRAVLDPFSVAAKSEELLRSELGALRGWHLRKIIRAYDLADHRADLESLSELELIEVIVDAVQPA